MTHMLNRPRRLRQNNAIRKLVQDVKVTKEDLVYPVFVHDGQDSVTPIESLPGQNRYSIEGLLTYCDQIVAHGLHAIALFPAISDEKKTSDAKEALNEKGLIPTIVKRIKQIYPDLLLVTDIALDPYSSDGHDGLVREGRIVNDATVDILAEMAVLHAAAGADIVAPSDMMDGRVYAIRSALEQAGFVDTVLLSYCAKYASALYGPFRDALQSAPKMGDKKTYQMNYANRHEAKREARLDCEEGADMLMIKPASWYLDIIAELRRHVEIPLAGYHVSGEYTQLKLAAKHGVIDFQEGLIEVLTAIKRAGADVLFSYGAMEI